MDAELAALCYPSTAKFVCRTGIGFLRSAPACASRTSAPRLAHWALQSCLQRTSVNSCSGSQLHVWLPNARVLPWTFPSYLLSSLGLPSAAGACENVRMEAGSAASAHLEPSFGHRWIWDRISHRRRIVGSCRIRSNYIGNLNKNLSSSSSSSSDSKQLGVSLSPALEARLRQLHSRCAQLEALLAGSEPDGGNGGGGGASGGTARRDTGREYSRLKPLAAAYERLLHVRQELRDLAVLMHDTDPRVRGMAEEEARELQQQAAALTRRLLLALVPSDPRDGRAALLEARAGAGGQEAALFCGELLEMYRKLATSRGWTWQVVELTGSEGGGVKHAVVAVSNGRSTASGGNSGADGGYGDSEGDGGDDGEGDGAGNGVYGALLPESGVHRVQRVPATEAQGRVHTSTAAVVVLPQADEVDVRIRDEHLRIETMRASGAGGQHVNVTDSAVRITHLPTGLVVSCQNERSQHQNRATALKVLRARLYDLEMQKRAQEMDAQRSALISSADRSERIRTYNFPQGRVTDHRIHLTVHDLSSVLEGGEGLRRLMGALRSAKEEEALRRLVEQEEGVSA
ncbi:hypothetical protein Vretimale_977 [Volvox reticuliferus]|uniref:Prokaryotic-type class I peptide chain release factors domain-containing protein n=1 Tax=Volvox reticuliferus TaxID=1737510 RepID=A0A8J4FLM8_9CHLO|nr:hypothetical protein Vretifemale_10512 [Volvox reticuliferus]GIL94902.1 hypothetical protein Vretimale_977 [Volvox reticuliferus]